MIRIILAYFNIFIGEKFTLFVIVKCLHTIPNIIAFNKIINKKKIFVKILLNFKVLLSVLAANLN